MDEYLVFAKNLARDAGAIMREHFQIGVTTEMKASEGNTPVTIADKTINAHIIEAVAKTYPTHAVLGEEQSLDKADAPYVWVCDPIDGTIPYAAGVPTNVFSLALVDTSDGQPKVAVVYDPYLDRIYHAVQGSGAFVNGVPIHVNNVVSIKDAMIGNSSIRSPYVDAFAFKSEIMKLSFRQLNFSSAIYEAMLVASGQLAAQIFVGVGAHDVATSKLIVTEAGGMATNLFGNEQRYDGTVCGALFSNGVIHDELVALARTYKL
jgi:myo-inositol-1(or 4)-monophosphatase